eukprot:428088_1
MSPMFLMFFGLLELSVSVPDCDWAYLAGEFIALNICQQHLHDNEATPWSYVIECNEEANGLQNRYFMQSETCDVSTHSVVEPIPALIAPQGRFHCVPNSRIPCNEHQYLIYRSYSCLPNTTNVAFRDYNLITDTCLGDPQSQTSQYVTCTPTSYSITSYSGIQCQDTKQRNKETIANNDCISIIHCPGDTDTTDFFTTTTQTPHTNRCKFINYDGSGHRIDTCQINSINSQMYSYDYQCNEEGDAVVYNYYYNTSQCDNDPLISMPITDEKVIDFECDTQPDTACNASDYMQLRVYTVDGGCTPNDLRTFDEDRMSEYAVVDVVVDQCLEDITGKFCMYQCSKDEWTVSYYNSPNCMGEALSNATVKYNEIDCYDHKVSHMIWCDGINNISYNESYAPSYVMDCNYFIDDYIGRPLGICADHVIGGTRYSFQYKCNAFKSGIEKHWYKNTGCKASHLEWIEFTDYDQFYCDSARTCDHLLVAKHYTNASCNRSEEFYYTDYVIVDECWPIGHADADYQTYSKVTCDEDSYGTALYTKEDCNSNAQLRSIEYDINDVCLWSQNHVEVTHCPNWSQDDTTPSPIDEHDILDCEWINMNGQARRIGVCNVAPIGDTKWSHRYECKPNGDGVLWRWFLESYDCDSDHLHATTDVTDSATSYNCDSHLICENFVKIKTYDAGGCEEMEEQFVTSESIIDACFADDYGESTLFKCDPNGNGYIIYEYHDAYCTTQSLWKVTPVAHKLCQPSNQRVEVVEACVSTTVVIDPSDPNEMLNFTECNYFYNGLFGVPLDVCHVYKKLKKGANNYTSVMYKCNEEHDAIIQYQYAGSECNEETQIGADEMPYSTFYCEADTMCDAMDILQMKWYENDSCVTDENYWGQSTSIMNVCWPNVVDDTSAVILCDGAHYIVFLYDNVYCDEPFIASTEYQSGECVDGNTFVIESGCVECHYWISTDGFGYPINHCFAMNDSSSSSQHVFHSFTFECTEKNNGIQQKWHKDRDCLVEEDTKSQRIPSHDVFDIKYAADGQGWNALELLTLKLYHNTECEENDSDWSHDIIIINQCLPTNDARSRIVSCSNDASFTIQMFEDSNCIQMSNESRIESGDCDGNGVKIEIINCGNPSTTSLNPTLRPSSMTPTSKLSFPPTQQDGYPPTRPEDRDEDVADVLPLKVVPCENFFGGGDVGRYDCKMIEGLMWLVIFVVVFAVGCCCAFAFCTRHRRQYCLYGPNAKEFDRDTDDSGNTYDSDHTPDHPRGIMINPSGLHNLISHNRKYNGNMRMMFAFADTESDFEPFDSLDDDEDDRRVDLLQYNRANPNTISSFNPNTRPSGASGSGPSRSRPSRHITSSEDDLISTRRVNSSNPHTMSSDVHIPHRDHVIASHLIGRTIQMDSIPIDIMAGVDMSVVNHTGSPQRLASASSSQIHSLHRPESVPRPSHHTRQPSDTDVVDIVEHYIQDESFFDGTRTAHSPHTQHSRANVDEDAKEESKEIFKRENTSDTEDEACQGQSRNESSPTLTYSVDEAMDRALNDIQAIWSKSKTPMQYENNQLILTGSCGGLHKTDDILRPGAKHTVGQQYNNDDDDHHVRIADEQDTDDEIEEQRLPRHVSFHSAVAGLLQ